MTTFTRTARIIRAPGRIIAAPTDLGDGDGTGEYGGSVVGSVRAVALQPLGEPFNVECEGLGEFSDVLEGNNDYVFSFFLRGWDRAGVEAILGGGYALGATTGQAVWSEPGSRTPGQSATGRALVWLFVPDDPKRHPAVLIRSGIADFAAGASLDFSHREELGLGVAVRCLRDGSDQILSVGLLDDLSL